MTKRTLCLSPLIIGALGWLFSGCAQGGSAGLPHAANSNSVPFEYAYTKAHPLPASRTIHLTSEDADVVVTGSDREDILIQARYELSSTRERLKGFDYHLSVVDERGDLRVTEKRQTGVPNFIYDKRVHSIAIEVPRNANVIIEEEDGSCLIKGIDGGVRLTVDDGKVELKECGGVITVALDNGTFSMAKCAGSVKLLHR